MTSLTAFTDQFDIYTKNVGDQLKSTFKRLTAPDYIRLIVIVGAYALLRPHLVQLGARFQAKDHERELDPNETRPTAAVDSKSLKGKVHVPEDTDSESAEESKKGTDWGKKARRQQRQMVRDLLAADEKRMQEDEEALSDKEIEEFLVEDENWLVETIIGAQS
ncbi:hypothetical protein MMC34_001758 [Xylographa carneopallida]|nr:hypothetical protein [Xylographa carneopallida]